MRERTTRRIRLIFNILSVLLVGGSIAIAVMWVMDPQRWNMEPLIGLLGILTPVVPIVGQWLVKRFRGHLRKEEMTMPYALAYGYLNNYLAPVVRGLRKELDHPDQLKFFVYIPDALEEMQDSNLSETIAELENKKYQVDTLELHFPGEKRKKDYRTAKRMLNDHEELKYFDFPTTLLGLEPAVEFKLETTEGQSPEEKKHKIGDQYIKDFYNQLQKLLSFNQHRNIRNNIVLVKGGGVDFLEEN